MTNIDKELIASGVMLADEYDPLEESRTLESMIGFPFEEVED